MAGNKKTKYMAGGGKSTKYKAAGGKFMGGGGTETGKEAKVQSYKQYVKKMFGGGLTNGKGTKGSAMGGPAMKKNK
tara:strand:- start:702 stop:929 length:228 start_codon:yes stop_codon:yes gene_type:complete